MVTSNRIARISPWLVPFLIFPLIIVAFLPSLQNGFVDWDDDANFLENPYYRGLGWEQLHWMFTTFYMGHYQPLTWATLSLDFLLWGMNPFGYHLTSLFLHATNGVVFYFIALRLLSLSSPAVLGELALRMAAGFAALIFAIHPLRVESVAWATERRDVLSGLFFLLSVLCYLRANVVPTVGRTRLWWMAAAVLIYGLSLLSEVMGVTLPLILLVLDVYPLRRLPGGSGKWFEREARWVWLEKIPFFLLVLGAGVIGLFAASHGAIVRSFEEYGVVPRLAQSLFGLAFYLWKTIAPVGLSPLYELPVHLNPWHRLFVFSGLIVLAISAALFVARHQWPAGLASWVYYVVVLLPVLGITQNGPQITADRYTYLSCLPWAILAGAGVLYGWQVWFRERGGWAAFILVGGAPVFIVVGLAHLTWRQAEVWHDSERLWRYVLAVAEKSYFKPRAAHYNLANLLAKQGDLKEAVEHYRQALQINPAHAEAHNNLGNALAKQGNLDEARSHLQGAIRIRPDYVEAHNNLGNVLAMQGDLRGAVEEYRQVLKLNPALSNTRFNLALALVKRGRFKEAEDEFRGLLKMKPDFVEAHYYLGTILVAQRDLDKGIDELKEALRLQPSFPEAHVTLARVLALQGKRDEAIQHYEEALRILKSRKAPPDGAK